MGYSLAQAVIAAGHKVILISGPSNLPSVIDAETLAVETAQQMYDAVHSQLHRASIVICCAAVADYRPKNLQQQKIKKSAAALTLELEPTPDILASIRPSGFQGFLVGFAAETEDLIKNATEKLRKKQCNLIIANDVSSVDTGFDSDLNCVTLITPDHQPESLSTMPKTQLAVNIIQFIIEKNQLQILP
jgi:phosphopantothenoylcysteine synthetase/decarboxylase